MISKIQRSRRQICDVTIAGCFHTGLETTTVYAGDCRARVSFRHPFIPNSFFASMLPWTGWVGAPKLSLPPGVGNPRCVTASIHDVLHRRPSHRAAYRFYRSTVVFSFFVSGIDRCGSGSGWRNSRFHIPGLHPRLLNQCTQLL